jgi:hypothetical protein
MYIDGQSSCWRETVMPVSLLLVSLLKKVHALLPSPSLLTPSSYTMEIPSEMRIEPALNQEPSEDLAAATDSNDEDDVAIADCPIDFRNNAMC